MSENNNPENNNTPSEQAAAVETAVEAVAMEVAESPEKSVYPSKAVGESESDRPRLSGLPIMASIDVRGFADRLMSNGMSGILPGLSAMAAKSAVATRVAKRNRIRSVKEAFEEAVSEVEEIGYGRRFFKHTMDVYEITNPAGILDPTEFLDKDGDMVKWKLIRKAREIGFASIDRAISFLGNLSSMEKLCDDMARFDGHKNNTFDRRISMARIWLKAGARLKIVKALVDEGWVFVCSDTLAKFDALNRPIGGINLDWHGGSDEDSVCYVNNPTVWGLGENHIGRIIELFREYLEERTLGTAKLTTIQAISASGLDTVDDDLSDVRLADSTFYPWMNGVSIAEYFMDFLASDANVLILYGPPGTAKSTMIRTAVKNLGLRALGTSNQQLIANPMFLTACGSKMAGSGSESPFDVLIAEDAEVLVRSRELGNPLMSTLLDVTNGMSAKHSFKLILTMNSDNLNDVDTALLRPGRCYDIMHFGFLDANEAANVRKALKLPAVHIEPGSKHVLAEVVNMGVIKTSLIEGKAIVQPRFPLANDKIIDRSSY